MKLLTLLACVCFWGCATHKVVKPKDCFYSCVKSSIDSITHKSWKDTIDVANNCMNNCQGAETPTEMNYCFNICKQVVDDPTKVFDDRVNLYTEIRLEECRHECHMR